MSEVYYIYRHIRLDINEPFYIGLGKVYNTNAKTHEKYYSRAFQNTKRNRFWNFITDKTDYEVEIIYECYNREEVIKKEIEFIALYGRRDLGKGTLVNMSDGGDGLSKNIQSPETIEKRKKLHAEGKTGLKPLRGEDSPVAKKVIEISTGKIFNSLTEASNYIGMNTCVFSAHLNHSNNQKNSTGFKFLDDNLNKEHIIKKRDVKVYDFSSNNIIQSISEASRLYKTSHRNLRAMLDGKHTNKTPLVYYEDYLKGIKPNDLYICKKLELKVINTETKEVYSSMSKVSKMIGMDKGAFANRMKGKVKNDTPYMLIEDYNNL